MIKDQDINHSGEYRLQLVTTNYRRTGHEYMATKKSALKRCATLKKHGYRVILFSVDEQGQLRQVS
jgi:hypothetical protein